MPTPTQVSVQSGSTGAVTFYSNYADARSNASSGDLINIYGDLNEQIILKGWSRYLDCTGKTY